MKNSADSGKHVLQGQVQDRHSSHEHEQYPETSPVCCIPEGHHDIKAKNDTDYQKNQAQILFRKLHPGQSKVHGQENIPEHLLEKYEIIKDQLA